LRISRATYVVSSTTLGVFLLSGFGVFGVPYDRRGDRTRAADGLVPPEPATESDDWSQRAEAAGDEE